MSAVVSFACGPSSHSIIERRQPLLRGPHVIGDDRDGVVEPHDLAHALDRLGRAVVDALHAPAEDGRLRERRDLHAGRPSVDAVDRGSIDLRRRVEPLGRRADQLEILRALQRDVRREPACVAASAASSPYFRRSSGRRVDHLAVLRAAGRRVDVPALGRGRDQHRPRGRARLAQRLPRAAHRVRVAGRLHAAAAGWRRASRSAAHARAAPASGRPRAPRRSASGSTCRCPGPSRRRAWSGRSRPSLPMRMNALGAKPSAVGRLRARFASGRLRLSNRPPPAAAPAWRKPAPRKLSGVGD